MTTRPDDPSTSESAAPDAAFPAPTSEAVAPGPAAEPPPEPAPPAPAGAPSTAASAGVLSRFFEWFWRRRALRELKQREPLVSRRAIECVARARAALELGEAALEPSQPFDHGPMEAQACELFRQATYWSLASLHARHAENPEAEAEQRFELSDLWQSADPAVLERAAGSSELAEAIRLAIADKSFADFAELPRDEQARLPRVLLSFARALSTEADGLKREIERVWHGRFLRLGVVMAVVLSVAAALFAGRERAEVSRDLARGKPWTASSKYPEGGCTSPNQTCAGESRYFFCTGEEENPWLEIDLQAPQRFSIVRIVNRQDCCGERAVPLVVEVSSDHKRWQEVAKRSEEFSTWRAKFSPVEARWVRVRAPRRTYLHLQSVRVLP